MNWPLQSWNDLKQNYVTRNFVNFKLHLVQQSSWNHEIVWAVKGQNKKVTLIYKNVQSKIYGDYIMIKECDKMD